VIYGKKKSRKGERFPSGCLSVIGPRPNGPEVHKAPCGLDSQFSEVRHENLLSKFPMSLLHLCPFYWLRP